MKWFGVCGVEESCVRGGESQRAEQSQGSPSFATAVPPSWGLRNLLVRKALFMCTLYKERFSFGDYLGWHCHALQRGEKVFQRLTGRNMCPERKFFPGPEPQSEPRLLCARWVSSQCPLCLWGAVKKDAGRLFVFQDDKLPDASGCGFYPWEDPTLALFS